MSISPSSAPGYAAPQAQAPVAPPAAGGAKIPILFGAVIALIAANIYLFVQLDHVKTDLTKTQDALTSELAKVREASSITAQTSRRAAEALRDQLETERRQARMAVGEAKTEALKRVQETEQKLKGEQAAAQQQMTSKITEVKQAADTANTEVAKVNTEVGNVKTDLGSTKSELEKTIADLKHATGDIDGHAVLIATNGKELAALRALGERNFLEFNIHKTKQPQKVGDVLVQLKKADPKHNRYTIELTADDKTMEKKDRSVNEPVQFLTSKARQPYEFVVNDVKKDQIVGYLSVPKVLTGR
jgi:chromosome segregation ATPase